MNVTIFDIGNLLVDDDDEYEDGDNFQLTTVTNQLFNIHFCHESFAQFEISLARRNNTRTEN